MTTLNEIERAVAALSSAEKTQLLQKLMADVAMASPGIERRTDVSGGDACIVRTRIPVWVLEEARRSGLSDTDILRSYPMLHPLDLANAWAYVLSHRDEIEAQIRQNEAA